MDLTDLSLFNYSVITLSLYNISFLYTLFIVLKYHKKLFKEVKVRYIYENKKVVMTTHLEILVPRISAAFDCVKKLKQEQP